MFEHLTKYICVNKRVKGSQMRHKSASGKLEMKTMMKIKMNTKMSMTMMMNAGHAMCN